jgi:segregation and condensation protein A
MTEPHGPKGPVKAAGSRPADDHAARERSDAYTVTLPTFEGPLDLLLHLIQKHELDIRDIPIGFITEKYLEYIQILQELSIDIASEYLVMAATLAHLKSKTLLPPSPHDEEDILETDEEDPRAELVRRLLEYQKYKLVAEQLGQRAVHGRDVFSRGAMPPEVEGPAPLAPLSLFKLLDALVSVLERFKQTGDHLIDFERITISDRINQLADVLRVRGMIQFEQLFEKDRSRADVIITFLALLEMTKLRLTRIWQDQPYDPIFIELAVRDLDAAEVDAGLGGLEARPPSPPVDAGVAAPDEASLEEEPIDSGLEPSDESADAMPRSPVGEDDEVVDTPDSRSMTFTDVDVSSDDDERP